MAEKLALFTFFTFFTFLLFAVSTARIFVVSKPSPEYDSGIVLPITEKPKSDLDETDDRLPEIEKKTQTLDVSTIDHHPTERLNFARLHPINRHFSDKTSRIPVRFVRRHPCRKFQKRFAIPMAKASYGNDMMLSENSYSFDPKTLGDDKVIPTEWLEFKHNYGGDHHHRHRHHEDHDHDDEDREEMVHSSRRHHKEKRGNNGGFDFMKRIRKFLKHTFD